MSLRSSNDAAPSDCARSGGSGEGNPRRRPVVWVVVAVSVALWLALSALGGPFFGRISEVAANDRSTFLPSSAESTEAGDWVDRFRDSDAVPAVIIAERPIGESVTDGDREWLESSVDAAKGDGVIAEPLSPPIASEDGSAWQIVVSISGATTGEDVSELRGLLDDTVPDGLEHFVTGPAGFTADLQEGFAGIDGLLLLVAVAMVFVILVVVYRSPVLPVVVLLTSMAALSASILLVWNLANAGFITINGQIQGILFILVVGAATDYSLLYVARYRDELRRARTARAATARALRGTAEPIAASGGTVIAGLLCLLLSDLSTNSALGPVAAIGIVMAIAAALTFLPALLLLGSRWAFWPFVPAYGEEREQPADRSTEVFEEKGVWPAIARAVRRRPRTVWIAMIVVLLVPLPAAFGFSARGVPQSELVLGDSEARDGQAAISRHFPQGSSSPTYIVVDENDVDVVASEVSAVPGVDSVAVTADTPRGLVEADGPGTVDTDPVTLIDGKALVEATLSEPADSIAAEDTVTAMRERLSTVAPSALVGGETATDLDTNTTAIRDRTVIIPLILIVVTVILMVLLRAVAAPLLLVALTVVSFGTALGVSGLVFDGIFDFPGVDPSVPLYGFVFLVALGIDYNIFLMSRVREESLTHGTRAGVLRALVYTGGVITSAGVVLAATFAALSVIPIMFLVQLSFIVTFGVLLDAILVRSLLGPGLVYDIGRPVWWPFTKAIPRDQ